MASKFKAAMLSRHDTNNNSTNVTVTESLNLDSVLNKSSQSFKTYNKVVSLELDKIIPNDNNFYSISEEEVASLADSIKTAGLQQHIIVLDNEDGTYKVITGHKRTLAFRSLAMEDDFYKYIPAVIITKDTFNVNLPISEDLKEKYLITITNSESRKKTDNDIYQEYLILKEIYQNAKNNGYKLNDRIRNILADNMNISAAQVGRMDYINAHATEETKEALANDVISLHEASTIAAQPEDIQKELIENVVEERTTEKVSENEPKAEKVKKPNIMDSLTESHYPVSYDILHSFKSSADDVQIAYDELEAVYGDSTKSYDITKKEYAKILKAKEDVIKQSLKLAESYNKLSDLFRNLQDSYNENILN